MSHGAVRVGSIVRCRERDWVVLPSYQEDVVMLRPLAGGEEEICGVSTQLMKYGIVTIGDLANTQEAFLRAQFGKCGTMLHAFANGLDIAPVAPTGELQPVKSVGNGLTTQEMTNWLPDGWDPDRFDLDEVNAALARLVPRDLDTALGELPPSLIQVIDRVSTLARFELYDWLAAPGWDEPDDFTEAEATALTTPCRVLLDAVGAGLTLTGAGYLPPRVVKEVFTGARMTEDWPGAGNREDLTPLEEADPDALVDEVERFLRGD